MPLPRPPAAATAAITALAALVGGAGCSAGERTARPVATVTATTTATATVTAAPRPSERPATARDAVCRQALAAADAALAEAEEVLRESRRLLDGATARDVSAWVEARDRLRTQTGELAAARERYAATARVCRPPQVPAAPAPAAAGG